MKLETRLLTLLAATFVATVWGGCTSTASEEDGTTGDDQNVTGTSDCDINVEATGKKMTAEELAKLNDPVAKLVIGGKICPKTFKEITEKMKQTDTEGCSPTGEGGGGVSTRFVSETAQALGEPDGYRAVFQRQCGKRQDHEFFISAFGISADSKALPNDVELVGQDKTTGVFNYYAREKGEWRFFGSSKDYVTAGYDCQGGACISKMAAKARCAGCHPGGGLVMKELESPWVHWEGDTETPGTDELINRFPELGRKGDGIDLEGNVVAGNREWVAKRVEILKEIGAAEVLRPLFCTLDINLQSASASSSVNNIANDFFLDPLWDGFEGVEVNDSDYKELLKQNDQKIVDGSGKQLSGKRGAVNDTFFAFTYPSRVRGNQDNLYNQELLTKKIVDDDFVKDVLHVDFTRPVFSKARCDLLQFAPKLTGDKITPKAIKDGFIANLQGKPGAAAQLLANLKADNDAAAHKADTDKFLKACQARPKKEMLADIMVVASQLRNKFREMRIAEFSESVAVDKIPAGDKAFDPATCTLK